LPFFVGVIDQSNLQLSLYSGEYLPIFFSHYGIPKGLKLSLEQSQVTFENYCEVKPEGKFTLRMPHVVNLEAKEDRESIAGKALVLSQLCSRMLQNISSRKTQEYVFKLGDDRVTIFAGPGSAQTFRNNFYYRLAEVFYNFEWLYRNERAQFNLGEYQLFGRFYRDLKNTAQLRLWLRQPTSLSSG